MASIKGIFSIIKPPAPIDGGRKFKNDKERAAVMLNRNRPVTSAEAENEILKRQVQALEVDAAHFAQLKADFERLTLFIRDNYVIEIDRKEPQHQGSAVDCAIHYMKKERSGARGIGPQ